MGIYVNPGNESFERAVNSPIYIDKTGMLEYTNMVLGTEQCCMCVSRPRRFGKSITASMLTAYYGKGADSRNLFSNYKISKAETFEKHMNMYDVIHIDLSDFKKNGNSATDLIDAINMVVIRELQEIYPDKLLKTEDYLPHALAELNANTGATFVIVIDEWDMIYREYKEEVAAQREYVDFLRGLFKAETSKRYIKLAYLTGILPIKRYNSESSLNNFEEFTMTSPKKLAEYIGFTENEVSDLCKKYDMDFDEARRWYDGYSFYRMDHVYSPNSVVRAMLNGEFGSYWTNSVAYNSLTELIVMNFDGLKELILQLLSGEHVPVDVDMYENDMTSFKSSDDVLTLLIHLGYLAYDCRQRKAYIPNEEVKTSFYKAIRATDWTPVLKACQASDALLRSTWEGDCEAVAAGIDAVHMNNTSILNYNDENALSCVITLAYFNAINEYTLEREIPAGRGFADILFRPRKYSDKPAMIVELKYDKSAESALTQIKEKNYVEIPGIDKSKLLLVGINYDKDSKKHSCIIEKIN